MSRPRLLELLGPATGTHLTVVSAPAGCGKTTLVRAWVGGLPEGTWAWLTVGPLERDAQAFWTAVIDSIHQVAPGLGAEAHALLRIPGGPVQDALLALLDALEVASFDAPLVIVVEDLHRATSPEVEASLAWFVGSLPESLHLVVTTRVDPHLPMAVLRERGDVTEVRQADLALSDAEATALLAGLGADGLPASEVHTLNERAEGWVAGLRMAGVTMRAADDAGSAALLHRWERSVAELLFDEVLATLAADRHEFLIQTSILDTLSPSVCDAVTGRSDSGTVLRELAAAQVFLEKLDGEDEWYRNHQLLGDLLQQELHATAPDLEPEVHRRASDWYAAADRPVEALEHAMASGDPARVLEALVTLGGRMNEEGQEALARSALLTLTDDFVMADLDQAMGYADALGWAGWTTQALDLFDRIQQQLGPADERAHGRMHLMVAMALGYAGDLDGCRREMAQVEAMIGGVPDTDAARWVPLCVGRAYRMADRYDEALTEFGRIGRQAGAPPMLSAATSGSIAELEFERGNLREAGDLADRAVEAWRAAGATMYTDALCAQARVRAETGDVAGAISSLDEMVSFRDWRVPVMALVCPMLTRIDLEAATGHWAEARRRLEEGHAWWGPIGLGADTHSRWREVKSLLDLQAGDLDAAAGSIERMRPGDRRTLRAARLALARGRPAEALRHLDGVDGVSLSRRIEARLLAALAHDAAADAARAGAAVDEAVALGLPAGYCLTFARELPLLTYYAELQRRSPSPELGRVLALAERAGDSSSPARLPEALTDRELELLHLLPTHLTTPELAATLFVSRNTVKTHLKSIYRKLDAASRSDAVSRARAAGLLR